MLKKDSGIRGQNTNIDKFHATEERKNIIFSQKSVAELLDYLVWETVAEGRFHSLQFTGGVTQNFHCIFPGGRVIRVEKRHGH